MLRVHNNDMKRTQTDEANEIYKKKQHFQMRKVKEHIYILE